MECYDRVAFKFGFQPKSVFNKTSADYNQWKIEDYAIFDFCGTPSTEANDNFFPWEYTITEYDAVEVSFETDIYQLAEKWPMEKPGHSGLSVVFRCFPDQPNSTFPYTTHVMSPLDYDATMTLPIPPIDYDPHRHTSFIGKRIRYLWDYEQGNHFVKNRYEDFYSSWSNLDNAEKYAIHPEDFTFFPPPATYTLNSPGTIVCSTDNLFLKGIKGTLNKVR